MIPLLVLSLDDYQDCIEPLLRGLRCYWPEFNGQIYISSETTSHSSDLYEIVNLNSGQGRSWSQRLEYSLKQIDSDVLMIIQDDYFVESSVLDKKIRELIPEITKQDLLGLTLQTYATKRKLDLHSSNSTLRSVRRFSPYYVNTAPALWSREKLLKVIKPHESIWQFEVFGSFRASLMNMKVVQYYSKNEPWPHSSIFPYYYRKFDSGMKGGKWQEGIDEYFETLGIDIDTSIRGMFRDEVHIDARLRTIKRLLKGLKLSSLSVS